MTTDDLGAVLPEHVPGLLRYARTLTRDPSQAEDLVQETLARALEKAATFRGESSPATWLHRILHNLSVDRARRDREVPVDEIVESVERLWQDGAYSVDVETVALRAQTRAELEDALVHLPVINRAAVLLHDMEGLTAMEIASIQSISLSAAKQRLRRGRMMLVTELARAPERQAQRRGVPMRCWDARLLVSDYLDGDLDDAEVGPLLRHLEGCPTCPPLYAALVATRTALGAAGGSPPSPTPGGAPPSPTPGGRRRRDPDSVIPPRVAEQLARVIDAQPLPGAPPPAGPAGRGGRAPT